MDTTTSQPIGIDLLAPVDERTALHLTRLEGTTACAFSLTHPYVEIVYLPLVGPTPVLVARYLGRLVAATDGPVTVCAAALAKELGLRTRSDDLLGRRSSLRRAIDRLEHQRLLRSLGHNQLGVVTEVPAVSDRSRAKLPPAAQYAHDQFVAMIDLSEHA